MSLACFEQTPAILGLTPFVRSATLSAQAISINHANRRTQRLQLKRQKNGNCIQELKQSSGKLHSVQWKLPPKHPQRKKKACSTMQQYWVYFSAINKIEKHPSPHLKKREKKIVPLQKILKQSAANEDSSPHSNNSFNHR